MNWDACQGDCCSYLYRPEEGQSLRLLIPILISLPCCIPYPHSIALILTSLYRDRILHRKAVSGAILTLALLVASFPYHHLWVQRRK